MKTKKAKTIEFVVRKELCTGCGTCSGICPQGAIEMKASKSNGIYLPKRNQEKCHFCNFCFEVCPGYNLDISFLNQQIFRKQPQDTSAGNYLNCYTGYSKDNDIRYSSSSGGLVTSLLIYALENELIDGALVTRMKKDNPLEPEPFIARTSKEIIQASKSKYCPVPANIGIREILITEGKFAVVGLPCHLVGIRKAEKINKTLSEKIVLHLGLFCGHVPNFHATRLLLKRLKVKSNEVSKLDYRGEGWPGYMKITKKDEGLIIPLADYYGFLGLDFFTPSRCLKCCDLTAELADLSFGDAWLPEFKSDKIGQSVMILRTETGRQLLKSAMAANFVKVVEATINDVKRSQLTQLYFKKQLIGSHLKLSKIKQLLDVGLTRFDILDYFLYIFTDFNHRFSKYRFLRFFLKYIPKRLLVLYRLPFSIIMGRKLKEFLNDIQLIQ